MTTTDAVNLVIGVAVLGFILYRQMQPRPVRANMRLPLILAVIGIIQLIDFLQHGTHDTSKVTLALAGSLILAAITAAIRALTVHVWMDGGQAWRQGNWLTALLWVVSIGLHLGYDYLVLGNGSQSGLASASLLLYFAVTYSIQRVIQQARAQRIGDAGQNTSAPAPSR